jgi:hypothetical protein
MARAEPPYAADETTMVLAFLDYLRETVVQKIEGLTEDQARWRPAPTANSLLNLVVHLTGVEQNWFERAIAGRKTDRDRDAELADLPPDVTIASAVDAYRRRWVVSNEIATGVSPDDLCKSERTHGMQVRWVLVHLLEETARHAGHADITRELIDGSTGE